MAAAWVLLALLAQPVGGTGTSSSAGAPAARDSLLNICMDAKHHKREPGPEGQLYGQVGTPPDTSSLSQQQPAVAPVCVGVSRVPVLVPITQQVLALCPGPG